MYYKESKNIKDIYILPSSVGNREIVYSPLRARPLLWTLILHSI